MITALYVLFKVGDGEYVLPAEEVQHMESFGGATRVPGSPSHVEGIVQIRRQVVPVVNLRTRFGLPAIERTLDARVVVVKSGPRTVGLLVDSAREVLKLDPASFHPPPEVVARQAQGYVKSVAQADRRLVMLIDFDRIIGEETLNGEQGS